MNKNYPIGKDKYAKGYLPSKKKNKILVLLNFMVQKLLDLKVLVI